MVTYIVNFFTSEEDKGAYFALQSSKCSIEHGTYQQKN